VSEVHPERVDLIHGEGRPAVYTFWHGVLLPLTYTHRRRQVQVLTSLHKDGEIISRILQGLGFGVLRGSSSRGSARGLTRMLARAVEGLDVAITPDGPTGPAKSVKQGAFYVCEKSGGALFPVGVAASRARHLGSWDSFMIPLPFSRVVVVYGEPLEWDESALFEDKAALLKSALERANEEARGLAARKG
jgi:lysophospholipid acyltransferase (LPLAT)-like uncharacterized protein